MCDVLPHCWITIIVDADARKAAHPSGMNGKRRATSVCLPENRSCRPAVDWSPRWTYTLAVTNHSHYRSNNSVSTAINIVIWSIGINRFGTHLRKQNQSRRTFKLNLLLPLNYEMNTALLVAHRNLINIDI